MATRVQLNVYVDLDQVQGTFHTADSAAESVRHILKNQIAHYNPTVSVVEYGVTPEKENAI